MSVALKNLNIYVQLAFVVDLQCHPDVILYLILAFTLMYAHTIASKYKCHLVRWYITGNGVLM